MARWQIRREQRIVGRNNPNLWVVVGRTASGFAAHYPANSRPEAEQIKANVLDGLDPYAGIGKSAERDFSEWEQELGAE